MRRMFYKYLIKKAMKIENGLRYNTLLGLAYWVLFPVKSLKRKIRGYKMPVILSETIDAKGIAYEQHYKTKRERNDS